MEKKEILKALNALKAEVEKKPEDKVLEKLEEILQAIRMQGWSHIHVCPPCTRLHYPPYYTTYGTGTTITVSGNVADQNTTGTYAGDSSSVQFSYTGGN